MAVSYKKLWKLLIDKDMKKKDLCEKAGISPASVTKMGRNGHVTTEILVKICAALDCRIEDILTKSFGEFIGLKNSAYVDINNCPFAPQLLNRGFAKDTGLYKESGFCSYPLWTFDETVLKETGGEKYERYARAYDEYMESSFIGMMGAEDETGEEICTGMMM